MSDQSVIVKRISWADLCPWTIIFRTLPVAASVTVLALALVGVLAASFTWWISETVFMRGDLQQDTGLTKIVRANTSPFSGVFADSNSPQNTLSFLGTRISGPRAIFNQIRRPATYLFANRINHEDGSTPIGAASFWYFLVGTVASMAVWSFIGLAIARVCLLRLTRNETIGIDDAFDFAFDHWLAAFGGVGIPLIAAFALGLPAALLGLLMSFDFGAAVVSLLWPLILALSVAMALLLLGLSYAWPLVVSSAACEGQNAFDAMTRSFAYVFQRPLHCLLYAVIAMLFGGFCWTIAAHISESVINLGYWATSWGANRAGGDVARIEVLRGIAANAGNEAGATLSFAQSMIGFWNGLIKTVAVAFLYGLFWCMASSIYLLLRKEVDDTETDEIYIVDERRTYELPPLKSDESGVPQVQTPTPMSEDSGDDAESDSNQSESDPVD